MKSPISHLQFAEWEALIRRDPGRRGVAGHRVDGRLIGEGQLEAAARDMAANCRAAAIVTGFAVFDGQCWTAETDGPPGAFFLARALRDLGVEVVIVGDAPCIRLLVAGCEAWDLPSAMIVEAPVASSPFDQWRRDFWSAPFGQRLTHLIAIERCGPSHVREEIPPAHRDRCHNMRGVIIDDQTAPLHRLFEDAHASAPRKIATVGMADGGNEIGMGKFAWEALCQAIAQGPAPQVACRIPCDYALVAGISNWAAYALAAAVCRLRSCPDLLTGYTPEKQRRLIESLVTRGQAVDGVTKRHEATVDGLAPEEYLRVIEDLVR